MKQLTIGCVLIGSAIGIYYGTATAALIGILAGLGVGLVCGAIFFRPNPFLAVDEAAKRKS